VAAVADGQHCGAGIGMEQRRHKQQLTGVQGPRAGR
jgi:hypothetical protein